MEAENIDGGIAWPAPSLAPHLLLAPLAALALHVAAGLLAEPTQGADGYLPLLTGGPVFVVAAHQSSCALAARGAQRRARIFGATAVVGCSAALGALHDQLFFSLAASITSAALALAAPARGGGGRGDSPVIGLWVLSSFSAIAAAAALDVRLDRLFYASVLVAAWSVPLAALALDAGARLWRAQRAS